MGVSRIKPCVLIIVTLGMQKEFTTKDVSESFLIKLTHPIKASRPQFNSFVGRAISKHRNLLMVKEIRSGTARGSVWKKVVF